jgi:hypothetical protein
MICDTSDLQSATVDARPRTLVVRSRLVHVAQGFVALTATAVPLLILAAAVGSGWSLVLLGIGAVLLVVTLRRAFRTELLIDVDGVTVINYWRTYKMRWDEIGDIWDGAEMLGAAVVPAIAFARRGGTTSVASLATSGSKRDRRRVLEHVRPYAAMWGIRVHDQSCL